MAKKINSREELKTIKVSDKIWVKLQTIKINGGYRSVDEVIERLLGEKQ
jgi:predicted CopG family antitoxin